MRPAVLLHQISGEESEGLPGVIDLLMAPDMEPDSIAHAELVSVRRVGNFQRSGGGLRDPRSGGSPSDTAEGFYALE